MPQHTAVAVLNGKLREPHESRSEAFPKETPELPTEKGFVVQLSRPTGAVSAPFAGRVEHLASGRRLRFADFEGFRAAVCRLLAAAKPL